MRLSKTLTFRDGEKSGFVGSFTGISINCRKLGSSWLGLLDYVATI